MERVRVGLVADPDAPTEVARRLTDLESPEDGRAWDIDLLSEPFTTGSEDAGTALERLGEHAREQGWDLVVGLTELPLLDDPGGHVLVRSGTDGRAAVLSLPALGGVGLHRRARGAVNRLLTEMVRGDDQEAGPDTHRRRGYARLLLGMVVANRPWLLVPGLKSALVAALTTGAVATINSTVWLLAGSLSWWRLAVATVLSIALVVGWLVIDADLWDRPEGDSRQERRRSRLYNTSTLVTLLTGVLICYLALYVVNLLWALFVLDPAVVGRSVGTSLGYGDLFVLAWFVASAATVGGGLGSGLESDEAVRAAAYSKREEDRRNRLGSRGKST